jgi:hypothetical protein
MKRVPELTVLLMAGARDRGSVPNTQDLTALRMQDLILQGRGCLPALLLPLRHHWCPGFVFF